MTIYNRLQVAPIVNYESNPKSAEFTRAAQQMAADYNNISAVSQDPMHSITALLNAQYSFQQSVAHAVLEMAQQQGAISGYKFDTTA